MSTTLSPVQESTYALSGMSCGSCEARVRAALEALPAVDSVTSIDRPTKRVSLRLREPLSAAALDAALGERYQLSELPGAVGSQALGRQGLATPSASAVPPTAPSAVPPAAAEAPAGVDGAATSWLATYRPLLTIVGLIALVSLLAQYPFARGLDGGLWMRHFMAGFFIVFAGFKLLDVAGFSESYAMYDIVAARLPVWGRIYPFVELALGLAYLTNIAPWWTNVATILILGVSAIGVVRSVLDRRAIRCACLGTGFNLPMSTVTIIEDLGMVLMAVLMLLR